MASIPRDWLNLKNRGKQNWVTSYNTVFSTAFDASAALILHGPGSISGEVRIIQSLGKLEIVTTQVTFSMRLLIGSAHQPTWAIWHNQGTLNPHCFSSVSFCGLSVSSLAVMIMTWPSSKLRFVSLVVYPSICRVFSPDFWTINSCRCLGVISCSRCLEIPFGVAKSHDPFWKQNYIPTVLGSSR